MKNRLAAQTKTRLFAEPLESRCLLSGYQLTDLGTLGGFGEAYAHGINERGQVVGDSPAADGNSHAFLWTPNSPAGVMSDLGIPAGSSFSTARDINDAGVIAGYTNHSALIWDGQMNVLPPLPGQTASRAFSINNEGDVVGWSGTTYYTGGNAVMWRRQAPPIQLGTVGTKPTVARAVNDSGTIVGMVGIPIVGQASYWAGAYPVEIGDLDNNGSDPRDINNQGQVVGVSHIRDGQWLLSHPFLHRPTGSVQDLGTMGCGPNEKSYGWATAINNQAQVVGIQGCVNTGTFLGPQTAAVWDSSNGWRDLQNLIPANTGWELAYATGINDRGQIIGYGFLNGDIDRYRSFLLTPDGRDFDESRVDRLPLSFATDDVRPVVESPELKRIEEKASMKIMVIVDNHSQPNRTAATKPQRPMRVGNEVSETTLAIDNPVKVHNLGA